MEWLKEKWIADGCNISCEPDYEAEDRQRLDDALCAFDRTLNEIQKKCND